MPVSSVRLAPARAAPSGTPRREGLASTGGRRLLDLDLSAAGQRVDDGDADAVQAAGDLVAAAAELAAGVQHGEHHGRPPGCPRSGATSVGMPRPLSHDPDAAVGEQGDLDAVAVAGQRLVDGVVDDLPDQVVQAALAGGADVHARALADRLEALEDLDRAGVVGPAVDRVALRDARRRQARRRARDPESSVLRTVAGLATRVGGLVGQRSSSS